MGYCKGCHRPVSAVWFACAWCGCERPRERHGHRVLVSVLQSAMLLEAIALLLGSVGLGVAWAVSDWSIERGQTLGILWIGALAGAALLAWLSVHLSGKRAIPASD